MKRTILGSPSGPWIIGLDGSTSAGYEFAWRCAEEGYTARVVRGAKMRSEIALFDELGAALQFPDYFGANWPAAAECLADLSWLPPGRGYVMVVTEPELVLCDEAPKQVGVLVRVLTESGESWASAVEDGQWWDRPPVPFHVVLQVGCAIASIRPTWGIDGDLSLLDD